ncbi:alpha-tocopherol transfer protein-like [Haematobia irritans]|uniref:alpha-tocopherol transfer protein-like n=1 Tax=Haematobia irritans TaxID=7368 RepID=UPI003F50A4B0
MMVQLKPLSEELQKVAIEELGEIPSRIPEDLEYLKTWINQQPHLRARMDDQFLIQFLRGCKYSREKAKEKLDYFHYLRTKKPEICHITNVDERKFRNLHNSGLVIPLPIPLNDTGPRLIMIRAIWETPKKFGMEYGLRYLSALHEVLMETDPYACIQGLIYVFDLQHFKKQSLVDISPILLKNLLEMKDKALPLRMKGVYIFNIPSYLEQFIKVAMTFVPEKLQKRIFVCGSNMDLLYNRLPRKYLPREYGGENGCLDDICKEYHTIWDDHREFFKQNAEYGTDEHLRIGEPLHCDDAEFGPGGSFRKVEVD